MKRLLASATAASLAVGGIAIGAAAPAFADPGDGTLTVHVVNDVDYDSTRGASDVPLEAVTVRLVDAAGNVRPATTDASGVATFAPDATLAGGAYRLEVVNPDADRLSEAQIIDGHTGDQFAPAVSFVDLAGGADQAVSVGFTDTVLMGAKDAVLYSALQPNDLWQPKANTPEVYSIPFGFTNTTPITKVTQNPTIGSVYGIGVDSQRDMVYAGAFAKRGSEYGPGGSGALYRVNPATGASEVYATIPNAGTTAHQIDRENHLDDDFAFRTAVGREALGDVDVSPDNRWVTTINLNTDELYVYPIQSAANPAPVQVLAIPAPGDCSADWTPFAIQQSGSTVHVGATCGETNRLYLFEYTRAADGTLSGGAVVGSGSLNPKPVPGKTIPAGMPTGDMLPGVRNGDGTALEYRHERVASNQTTKDAAGKDVCSMATWFTWRDDLPTECLNGVNLIVSKPTSAGQNTPQVTFAQPMLSDIEITSSGDIVFSIRDRSADQFMSVAYVGQNDAGEDRWGTYIVSGDVLAVTNEGGQLTFNAPHDYQDGSKSNNTATTYGPHMEASFAGIAYLPGTDQLVGNTMDAVGYYTNGLRRWDTTTGLEDTSVRVRGDFSKGAGLADLDVLVKKTQQIGNRIWIDTDGDGIQDPDEKPVAGVQVSLYRADGTLVATTETDANGEYWFATADGLEPSTAYEVRLDRAADTADGGPLHLLTPTDAATGEDRGIDSDGLKNADGIVVATITSPAAGVSDHSIDFGFVPPVSIGDYLWLDANRDGKQTPGEKPVAGATVKLLDRDGAVVAETTTDANGYYVFADLPPGADFQIEFPSTVTVDGVVHELTEQGGDAAAADDSNPDVATGIAPVTTPRTGSNSREPGKADLPTIDAGYVVERVSIGDFVWIDEDGDGRQGDGEKPVAGATVELRDADGTVVGTTTTDANGYYAFVDLAPNTTYTVVFPTTVTVDGVEYRLIAPGAEAGAGDDSNPDAKTGEAVVTTPARGENSREAGKADDPTIDAGYSTVLVSVGDYVWFDTDGDGLQGDDEKPAAGVTVTLRDASGAVISTTTTDANGFYSFTGLTPGAEYSILFPETVTDADGRVHELTVPGAGSDDAKDSDPAADGVVSFTAPATGDNSGEPGEVDLPTIDAGYRVELVSIGDHVWIDQNGDGIQDATEKPVAGIAVQLLDANGDEVATATTDENGWYVFTDLAPNTEYTVHFPTSTTVDGVTYTLTKTGAGEAATDSNANPTTGDAKVTTPARGANSAEPGEADDPTIDAGYTPQLVSVGDYVWIDADGDGTQGASEKPAPGVTVKLFDANGTLVKETSTDENGWYVFTDLQAGADYTIEFPTSIDVDGRAYPLTQPGAGDDVAADSNPTADGRVSITAPSSGANSAEPGKADDPTIDAGYAPVLVSVGDHVWIDADGDGVQDAGEKPAAGVTVKLYDADGTLVKETTTDENGWYVFTDLWPNTDYVVEFPTTITVGGVEYPLTKPAQGDDSAADSNPSQTDGRAPVKTPVSGSNSAKPGEADDPTIDAGYAPVLVSVGDHVWIDADGDGIQDADEKPAAGVVVKLYDADGTLAKETTTDADGWYVFTDLEAGREYSIEFPKSITVDGVEYPLTEPGQGDDAAADSNPGVDGRVAFTAPTSGSNSAEPGEADDPTIDAGYVPAAKPVDPTTPPVTPTPEPTPVPSTPEPTPVPSTPTAPAPSTTPTASPDLPATGTEVPMLAIGAALLLLASGAGVLVARRRAQH